MFKSQELAVAPATFSARGAAFWIFIAVVVWASTWEKARRNAEKHETLRRIIEKTGTIDEAKLKELFAPPPVRSPATRLGHCPVHGVCLCLRGPGDLPVIPRW
jgi:hypothetical protein